MMPKHMMSLLFLRSQLVKKSTCDRAVGLSYVYGRRLLTDATPISVRDFHLSLSTCLSQPSAEPPAFMNAGLLFPRNSTFCAKHTHLIVFSL